MAGGSSGNGRASKRAKGDQADVPAEELRPRLRRRCAEAFLDACRAASPAPADVAAAWPRARAGRVVVFSGSGISAAAGMSTFSEPGGLYERARRRYKLDSGVRLFYYSFFKRRRADAHAFFADVWREAAAASPTPSHVALAELAAQGRLVRHYTMNIDGLHRRAGLSTWGARRNPSGLSVEMHGCVLEAVCEGEACKAVLPLDDGLAAGLARGAACPKCGGALRIRVMMYDDEDEELITDDFEQLMERDLASADVVLWMGISFEQSASVEHFRRARRCLQDAGRDQTPHIIVNPSGDAAFNLVTGVANAEGLEVFESRGTADEFLPLFAEGAAPEGASSCSPS